MAKSATPKTGTTKATEGAVFDMPVADPSELIHQFREMAEDGLNKSKAAVEKARSIYEDLQKEAETGLHTAQAHTSKISLAAIDAMRANSESTFAHLEKMVGVKSVAEMIELQTAFMREQAEKTVDTAKNMQSLYQKAGEEMTAPAKAAAEKAMGALKND